MTTEWNGDAAIDAMREEIARRLLAAASTLQIEHMKKLNVFNPPPKYLNSAKPGDWPHKRTGFGQSHVFVEPATIEEIKQTLSVRIGYGQSAFYMAVLQTKGWLGIYDTLQTIRPKITAMLSQGGEIRVG